MTNLDQKDLLLEIKNLQVSFKTGKNKIIKIVRGVDLKIKRKQIIGLVLEEKKLVIFLKILLLL